PPPLLSFFVVLITPRPPSSPLFPYTTLFRSVRQLADWGADVIKIEMPEDDGGMGGPRDGPDFQNLHRNKRSMTLDLKSPKGVDRSEEHTSELQSLTNLVCRLLLEKKKKETRR